MKGRITVDLTICNGKKMAEEELENVAGGTGFEQTVMAISGVTALEIFQYTNGFGLARMICSSWVR